MGIKEGFLLQQAGVVAAIYAGIVSITYKGCNISKIKDDLHWYHQGNINGRMFVAASTMISALRDYSCSIPAN